MSTHDDNFRDGALPLLMAHFGDTGRVTYIPRGGSPVALTATVGNEEDIEEKIGTGRRRALKRKLTITTDAAGQFGGVATPQLNATVTVDSVSYAVSSVKPLGRDVFDLVVVRYEPMEISRSDYRGR